MSYVIARDPAPIGAQFLNRLLVNGEPAALVGAVRDEAALLLASYYGHQWKWWALIGGVKGLTWLVRNHYRETDFPLLLELEDNPILLKSSDELTVQRGHVRTRRIRKRRAVNV